jgi:hypothetical protein
MSKLSILKNMKKLTVIVKVEYEDKSKDYEIFYIPLNQKEPSSWEYWNKKVKKRLEEYYSNDDCDDASYKIIDIDYGSEIITL